MEISMPLMSRRDADPSDDFFLFLLHELPWVALMWILICIEREKLLVL